MSERRRPRGASTDTLSPPRPPCHIGVISADIDRGMKELAQRFAVEWMTPSTVEDEYITPSGRLRLTITVAHSSGPISIELIQGAPGSLWGTNELTQLHHYAFWSSDLAADVLALQAKNYELELTVATKDDHLVGFAYLVRPGSARLELIERAPKR